ncbi:MAG: energy transducer TonB [Elusimicrobia bacterium]|nr:energy transducer TonB [Elusimicrobiota bacterium]
MTSDQGTPVRDLVFLGVAAVLHGGLLVANPGVKWGDFAAADKIVPIEFVKSPTSPFLAPIPPGQGQDDELPDNGPGPVVIPKKVAPNIPAAKPVPAKKAPAAKKAKKPKPAPTPAQLAARQAAKEARWAAREAKRQARLAARQALRQAKEAARQAREAALASARQKRVELSRALSELKDPDEALAGLADAGPAAGAAQRSAASLDDGPGTASDGDLRDSVGSQLSGGGIKRSDGSISWSIDGPIGTRRLLARRLPVSPDWVSSRGLDLTVRVKFQVLENGSVKPGAIIKVTSGFPELDVLALDAIKLWKFEAVPSQGASAPQTWGVVTFRFTMR